MKVNEIFSELLRRGIDSRIVYIGEGSPEDRYAIILTDGLWTVFYTEKGEHFELKRFLIEEDACEYFFILIDKDKTVKNVS